MVQLCDPAATLVNGAIETSLPQHEKGGRSRPSGSKAEAEPQRFENWKLRRAFFLPYFLRSTTRGSRVRNPSRFKGERRSGS